jgi:hypothetical protein
LQGTDVGEEVAEGISPNLGKRAFWSVEKARQPELGGGERCEAVAGGECGAHIDVSPERDTDRHEGDDVDDAEARVDALVLTKVKFGDGFRAKGFRRFEDILAGEREHRAVVVRVGLEVKKGILDPCGESRQQLTIPAFADVYDALEHHVLPAGILDGRVIRDGASAP